MSAEPRPSPAVLPLLLFLTLAAFGLRLRGLSSGLPCVTEPDCKIPIQVELIESGAADPELEAEFQWYPTLLARLALLLPRGDRPALDAPLERHLEAAARPVLKTRAVAAALGALLVPIAFLLARAFLPPLAALFAAALCATSLLHASFSQQARPHGPAAALFAAAVLGAFALRRRGTLGAFALAGATSALAFACLQSGLAVLPAPLLAYALRARERGRWLDPRLLAFAVPLALAVPAFYPFLLRSDSSLGTHGEFLNVPKLGGHLVFLDQFNGKGLATVARTLWTYDPVLLGLCLLGAAALALRAARGPLAALRGARDEVWIALAFALPYGLAVALYERSYERFVLPLVPFLAVLGAWGARECGNVLARAAAARARRAAAVLAALAVLALPAWAAWRLGSVRAAPHTTERAAQWVRENLGTGDRIALTMQLDLPLWRAPEGLERWGKSTAGMLDLWWTRYQARLPGGAGSGPRYRLAWMPARELDSIAADPRGFLAAVPCDYAVIEVFAENRVHPAGTALREALREHGRLLARISPDRLEGASEHPLGWQDETSVPPPPFLSRLLQARGAGPVIEIYDLRGAWGGAPPR